MKTKRVVNITLFILGTFFVIILWSIGHSILPSKIPKFQSCILSIVENFSQVHKFNVLSTFLTALSGLGLSVFLSALIFISVGVFKSIENFILPILVLIKSSPALAFVPIFTILLGTGFASKILVSSMICLFPLAIGVLDGFDRIPLKYNYFIRVYSPSRFKSLFLIKTHFALEGLLSGLKTAAPLSVVGAIVGEYVIGGSNYGLGNFIISNTNSYAIVSRYVGVLLSTMLGLFFFVSSMIIYNFYANQSNIKK